MKKVLWLVLALGVTIAARAAFHSDIEYGMADGQSLKLDAYIPEGAGPFPTVILVHGGGWTGGDKSGGPRKGLMAPMHEPLQQAGFAWFSVNYRLAPKDRYPACVEDVETAIRWVKANAARYHIDVQRIALSGESAGGHIVAAVVTRAKADTRVAAVVPFYGPFDLTFGLESGAPLKSSVAALVGHTNFDAVASASLRDASPLFAIKPGLPPFLLVHGTGDVTVPFGQSERLLARLKEAGVRCELLPIKGGAHGMLGWPALAPDYKEAVVAWLERTLITKIAKQ